MNEIHSEKEKNMRKNFDIIHGNPRQCLFAMVLPMMAAMFLNMAYNLVDSLWIGNLLGAVSYTHLDVYKRQGPG